MEDSVPYVVHRAHIPGVYADIKRYPSILRVVHVRKELRIIDIAVKQSVAAYAAPVICTFLGQHERVIILQMICNRHGVPVFRTAVFPQVHRYRRDILRDHILCQRVIRKLCVVMVYDVVKKELDKLGQRQHRHLFMCRVIAFLDQSFVLKEGVLVTMHLMEELLDIALHGPRALGDELEGYVQLIADPFYFFRTVFGPAVTGKPFRQDA